MKRALENPAPGSRTAAARSDGKRLVCHATTASPLSPIPTDTSVCFVVA